MAPPHVILASTSFAAIHDSLREALPDATVDSIDRHELRERGAAGEVLIPAMACVDGALMDRVQGLRLVQQWGVGLDGVDVAAATARKVAVANVGSADSGNAESVAEWCVMAAIALSRRLAEATRGARAGAPWGAPMGRALIGRTAGIVGLGGIGQALALRLRPFEMRVVGVTRTPRNELCERLGLDWLTGVDELPRLLDVSDYLFLCLPRTPETAGLIDRAALARLPQGAAIVSAGRGGVLSEDALLVALSEGRLSGAALDVFASEPLDRASPLLSRDEVIATPHVAGVTDASYRGIARRVADNVRALADGRPLRHCVNEGAFR